MDLKLIEEKKAFNAFIKEAKARVNITKCMWCGTDNPKFCNSHTIPQFVLKRISKRSGLLNFSMSIYGSHVEKDRLGITESGVFKLICRKCDNLIFRGYESEDTLLNNENPQLILSSIAFKNSLKKLYDSMIAVSQLCLAAEKSPVLGKTIQNEIVYYDSSVECYNSELNRIDQIMCNKTEEKYKIIDKIILPYVTPIATQSSIVLNHNISGKRIEYRQTHVEFLQLCVFPLQKQTLVMMFAHEEDTGLNSFYMEYAMLSDSEKLDVINFIIFQYTDEYLLSDEIPDDIFTEAFTNLCRPPSRHSVAMQGEEEVNMIVESKKYPNMLKMELLDFAKN